MKIKNLITHDTLTDNSKAAQHPQFHHGLLPDRWKGITSDQGGSTRKGQGVQHGEKKEQYQAKKALDAKLGSRTIPIPLAEAALELEQQERELFAELRRGWAPRTRNRLRSHKSSEFHPP